MAIEPGPEDGKQAPQGAEAKGVPGWFPIAGMVFGGLTLVFFMALVLFRIDVSGDSRFGVIAVFSLGAALAVSFLGGSAAASGQLPIPFFKDNPIQFSAAGGVATLVIVMILSNLLIPNNPVGPGSDGTPTPRIGDQTTGVSTPDPPSPTPPEPACIYFQYHQDRPVFVPREIAELQIAEAQRLLSLPPYSVAILVSLEPATPDYGEAYQLALADRRSAAARLLLASYGIPQQKISVQTGGPATSPARMTAADGSLALCYIRIAAPP
jgi:hypothetical protein